jgi:hypothetical protein
MKTSLTKRESKQLDKFLDQNNAKPPKQAEWAIVDISGSMDSYVGEWGASKRRIECLNAALMELGTDVQVIAFSDGISTERIGEYHAGGETKICPALREVVKHEPSYIVIISDGDITDSKDNALGLIDKIAATAVIDTIYIGPDDSRGEGFLKEAATIGHGRFRKYDPATISEKIQTLLPAPSGPLEMSSPVSAVTSKPTDI